MDEAHPLGSDNSSEDEDIVVKKRKFRTNVFESDEEAVVDHMERGSETDSEEELDTNRTRKNRRGSTADSDSEGETRSNGKCPSVNKSQPEEADASPTNQEEKLEGTDNSEEDIELDDDAYHRTDEQKLGDSFDQPKLERKSKTKAKSTIETIHSESQRLVRESPVALPYHRPRQRTLAEFLQRRKPVSNTVKSVWKQLEEREREAEDFYKTESSDSEKESDQDKKNLGEPNAPSDSNENSTRVAATPLDEQKGNKPRNNLQVEVTNGDVSVAPISIANGEKSESMGETNTILSDTEVNVLGRTKSDIQDFCEGDTETQFNLLCNKSTTFKNDSIEGNETRSEICTPDRAMSHNSDTVNFKNLLLNLNRSMDTQLNSKSNSVYAQDFVLHFSESESRDTMEATSTNTLKENVTFSNKGTSTANDATDMANNVSGPFSQNLYLHYSESISLDDNENANETAKCNLLLEQENKDVDISLRKKGIQDNSNDKNICVLEDETQWWRNIHPPSDSDSGKEKDIENQNRVIAKHKFPNLTGINLQPKLSGTASGVIDLEEGVAEKGVLQFVQRIIKHSEATATKKPKRKTKEISVVSAEKNTQGVETVQKDVVTVNLEDDDEPLEDASLSKPGAKLKRLQEELQHQMVQKRAAEWQKRQQEQKLDNEELDEEGEPSECGTNEEEMSDSTTESETEDEDDVAIIEKKRTKSCFVDDEAEVSEDDTVEDVDESEDADDEMGNEDEEDEKSTKIDTKADKDEESAEAYVGKPKLQRVKTADIDIEDETTQMLIVEDSGKEDLELTGSLIPAYQLEQDGSATPLRNDKDEPKRDIYELISPASDLTPLRSSSNLQSVSQTPLTATTISCDQQSHKRLFTESEHMSTQAHMGELAGLCSGTFSGTPPGSEALVCDSIKQLVDPAEASEEELEELVGLCSGIFSSIRYETKLLAPSDKTVEKKCEKKLAILSSDEEDTIIDVESRSHKKGVHKKLTYSDEEEEVQVAREVKPADKDSAEGDLENGDEDDENNNSDVEIPEYDSEENEISLQKRKKEAHKKMTEYFEDEAELSESDWDSLDEDERGLNRLEKEEGDDDQLDQEAVKEELKKIHMRRVLDEDKREVRLLQEILLDDGELHSEGGGRERKFRWKNIDNVEEVELTREDSDNAVSEGDEEDEAEWRRRRFEREAFLEKQKEAKQDDDEDSKLLQLGKVALKRMQDMSEKPGTSGSSSAPQLSPDSKQPFKLLTKRGSFLARGESALARITQRASESADVVSRPKTARNFVFTAVSPGKEDESSLGEKPVTAVKRSSTEPLPPVEKRSKITEKKLKGKKLLDFLT